MDRQQTLEQVVQSGMDTLKATIYTRMPGGVVSYDPSTQTADVQPMLTDVRFDLDTGAVVFEPWSVIRAVPVKWPRMGGFVIAGFLEQNDQVVLEAFDLDPTPWRAQGRSTKPVNPVDVRRLGGNYWSADPTDLTGPSSDPDVLGGASLVIGVASGATLVFKGTTITLGALASQVTIGSTAASVGVGSLPAPLATGVGTAAAVAALGVWCAALQAELLVAVPPSATVAAIAAVMVTPTATLAAALTAAALPGGPVSIPTTTVLAGP